MSKTGYLKTEFGRTLADMRRARGLSQMKMAERTGIAQADISRHEQGHGNPTLSTLERLGAALGCRVEIRFVPEEDED